MAHPCEGMIDCRGCSVASFWAAISPENWSKDHLILGGGVRDQKREVINRGIVFALQPQRGSLRFSAVVPIVCTPSSQCLRRIYGGVLRWQVQESCGKEFFVSESGDFRFRRAPLELVCCFFRNLWETDFCPALVLGRIADLSMRVPNPSPILDKSCAPMGPEILSSTGAGVWRMALEGFQTPVPYWINFSLRSHCFVRMPLSVYIYICVCVCWQFVFVFLCKV